MTVYIDGQGCILGRLASHVAKRLLNGEQIIICNVERIIITGDSSKITNEYAASLKIRTKSNPNQGPFHPRTPEGMVRRTIRGMLPWKKPKGKAAYKRLKVYVGVPEEFEKEKLEVFSPSIGKDLRGRYLHVGELARRLGKDNKYWRVTN